MDQQASSALIASVVGVVLGGVGLVAGLIGYVQGTAALRRSTVTRQRAASAEEAALQANTRAEASARAAERALDRLREMGVDPRLLVTGPTGTLAPAAAASEIALTEPARGDAGSAAPPAAEAQRAPSAAEQARDDEPAGPDGTEDAASLPPEDSAPTRVIEVPAGPAVTGEPGGVAEPRGTEAEPQDTDAPAPDEAGSAPETDVERAGDRESPRVGAELEEGAPAEPHDPDAEPSTPTQAPLEPAEDPTSEAPDAASDDAIGSPGPDAEPSDPQPAKARTTGAQVAAGEQAAPPMDWAEAVRTGSIPLPARSRGTYAAPRRTPSAQPAPVRFEVRAVGRQRYEAVNVGDVAAVDAIVEGVGDDGHLVRPLAISPATVAPQGVLGFSVLRVEGRPPAARVRWRTDGETAAQELRID